MLDRNIAEMAAFAKAHNVKLRPHSKTHKSADIAKRQIAAGALGVCCAKLGEAEALAEAGRRASAHHLAGGDAAGDRAADRAERQGEAT